MALPRRRRTKPRRDLQIEIGSLAHPLIHSEKPSLAWHVSWTLRLYDVVSLCPADPRRGRAVLHDPRGTEAARAEGARSSAGLHPGNPLGTRRARSPARAPPRADQVADRRADPYRRV